MNRRHTARLIVLDRDDRLLVFLINDGRAVHPAHPDLIAFWLLPGGGIDPGETASEAALRELREETGITGVEPGPCVWTHERVVNTHGEDIHFFEEIFLVRVGRVEVSMSSLLPYETITHQKLCWLTPDEIATSTIPFLPLRLPEEIEAIRAGVLPETPIPLYT